MILPQTMSSVQACMYVDRSKFGFPASLSKFSSIILVLLLNIGTNDCSIFRLKVGFRSFRIGLQNAPAVFGRNQKFLLDHYFWIIKEAEFNLISKIKTVSYRIDENISVMVFNKDTLFG